MDFVLPVSTSNRLDKEFCMAYLSTLLLVLDTGLMLSLYWKMLPLLLVPDAGLSLEEGFRIAFFQL